MGEGEQPAGDPVQDGPDPRLGWFERRINAGLPKVKPDKLDKFMKGDPMRMFPNLSPCCGTRLQNGAVISVCGQKNVAPSLCTPFAVVSFLTSSPHIGLQLRRHSVFWKKERRSWCRTTARVRTYVCQC